MWGWTTRPHIWGRGAIMPAIMGDWPSYDERLFPGRIYPIENSLMCGQNQAYDMCFELLTEPQWVKWNQPFTGIRQWRGYAGNESMALESEDGELFILRQVADDWLCEKQVPVTAVAWNGCYIGYGYEACKCNETQEPLKPDYFLLSIWSNVSGVDAELDNYPGEKIWEYEAYEYDEVMVGYDQNPESEPNEAVFRYSVKLPEESWFMQETSTGVYWLGITAVYRETIDMIPYSWGLTNHNHMFGNTAQSLSLANEGPLEEPVFDKGGEFVDMSFALFTTPEQ